MKPICQVCEEYECEGCASFICDACHMEVADVYTPCSCFPNVTAEDFEARVRAVEATVVHIPEWTPPPPQEDAWDRALRELVQGAR